MLDVALIENAFQFESKQILEDYRIRRGFIPSHGRRGAL